jgi:hypothetical protein
MSHIMHYAVSSLLLSVQYTVLSPRDFNNIYAATSEVHTTVFATNCVAQQNAICNYIN